jgi:hypothetical protein
MLFIEVTLDRARLELSQQPESVTPVASVLAPVLAPVTTVVAPLATLPSRPGRSVRSLDSGIVILLPRQPGVPRPPPRPSPESGSGRW